MNLSGTDPNIIYGMLYWSICCWGAPERHAGEFGDPFHTRNTETPSFCMEVAYKPKEPKLNLWYIYIFMVYLGVSRCILAHAQLQTDDANDVYHKWNV